MGSRHKARVAALKVLYECSFTGHDPEEVLDRVSTETHLSSDAMSFSGQLIAGVLHHSRELDRIIARFAPVFPVPQMSAVDRSLLRLGIHELVHVGSIPTKVAINEAVELAKLFGGDSSARLVNGVLGSVAAEYRTSEIDGPSPDAVR